MSRSNAFLTFIRIDISTFSYHDQFSRQTRIAFQVNSARLLAPDVMHVIVLE